MTDPFVGISDLGAYLRKDLTTDDMALIAVNAACDVVAKEIGQELSFVEGDDVLIDGSGTDAMLLPQVPVLGVSYVALWDNQGGVEDEAMIEGEDWRLAEGGILYRTDLCPWPRGRASVRVIYDHGYATTESQLGSGGVPGIEPVPDAIRLVALSLAARIYAVGIVGVGGVQSETIGSYSYTLSASGSAAELTNLESTVLGRYRVRRPVSYVYTEAFAS